MAEGAPETTVAVGEAAAEMMAVAAEAETMEGGTAVTTVTTGRTTVAAAEAVAEMTDQSEVGMTTLAPKAGQRIAREPGRKISIKPGLELAAPIIFPNCGESAGVARMMQSPSTMTTVVA